MLWPKPSNKVDIYECDQFTGVIGCIDQWHDPIKCLMMSKRTEIIETGKMYLLKKFTKCALTLCSFPTLLHIGKVSRIFQNSCCQMRTGPVPRLNCPDQVIIGDNLLQEIFFKLGLGFNVFFCPLFGWMMYSSSTQHYCLLGCHPCFFKCPHMSTMCTSLN